MLRTWCALVRLQTPCFSANRQTSRQDAQVILPSWTYTLSSEQVTVRRIPLGPFYLVLM